MKIPIMLTIAPGIFPVRDHVINNSENQCITRAALHIMKCAHTR